MPRTPVQMTLPGIPAGAGREAASGKDAARAGVRRRYAAGLAGSTEVSFERPGGKPTGTRQHGKLTIAEIWDKWWHGAAPIPSRWGGAPVRMPMERIIQAMHLRVFDEVARTFVTSHIRNVFQAGVKPIFRVTLENGRTIECSRDHKFLTQHGYQPLGAAIGLRMVRSTAAMSKPDAMLASNGILAYTDREWLAAAKLAAIADGSGLSGIAERAGVTTHTIRKWLKKHQLQFTKKEVYSYTGVWNKGLSGYHLPRHRPETIEKMRRSAKRGPESNLWRGGADRSERVKIQDWCLANRSTFLRAANYQCKRCGSAKRLEMHHIQTVVDRPDLAYEPTNIEVLCRDCHRAHHRLNGDVKRWNEARTNRGNFLTVHWSRVRHIEYVGEQMTYDLEVEHAAHNYIGNGVILHSA